MQADVEKVIVISLDDDVADKFTWLDVSQRIVIRLHGIEAEVKSYCALMGYSYRYLGGFEWQAADSKSEELNFHFKIDPWALQEIILNLNAINETINLPPIVLDLDKLNKQRSNTELSRAVEGTTAHQGRLWRCVSGVGGVLVW